MAGRKIICENLSNQSLMTALNKFVEVAKSMDSRVMFPSRLRDMGLSHCPEQATSEENNNMSVLPFSSSRNGDTLYSYYVMINVIKQEILCGNVETDMNLMDGYSVDSDDSVNSSAKKTAEAFRHHLQGLSRLLHQLTDTAKLLADTYEDQVGLRKDKKFSF